MVLLYGGKEMFDLGRKDELYKNGLYWVLSILKWWFC